MLEHADGHGVLRIKPGSDVPVTPHSGATELAPGDVVLWAPGEGGHGAVAASAMAITVVGRGRLQVTRGRCEPLLLFARR
jgi:hypothetical protein